MSKNFLKGKRVLLTIGPTREYIDPVRYISNASSGKMGWAIASRLKSLGARVFVVSGPGIGWEPGFDGARVTSARQMLSQVGSNFAACDVFISCAAVSDYRPKSRSPRKIRKGSNPLRLDLVINPDILAAMGKRKKNQLCVGFALEDNNPIRSARDKMIRKNCDVLVLNGPQTLESDFIQAAFLFPDGRMEKTGRVSKDVCAEKLCQTLSSLIEEKSS